MSTASTTDKSAAAMTLKRSLWAGVLPEALGLCFVVIIFGGFAATYLLANHTWQSQTQAQREAETRYVAEALATAVGARAEVDEETVGSLLAGFGERMPALRAIEWIGADGRTQATWPLASMIAAEREATEASDRVASVRVPVVSPDGAPLGLLKLARTLPMGTGRGVFLLWNWGIAAGVTLIVFAGFYYRLRRHLRPVAAIERSLCSYADGVESELATLTLSDSLGLVARGWNRLLEELGSARQQLQNTAGGSSAHDVLARFEGAVFRRIVDRLPHGVLWVGEDQSVTYANASAAALLGIPLEQLVGMPVGEAVDNPSVVQAVVAARGRSRTSAPVDYTRGEGEQESTLRFRIQGMADSPGSADAMITLEDISQLREGQRARDNFLYHVTHELRTPLTNIHAYVETLSQPGFDDEQTRKECYNVLISETERLSRLVEDILSISQFEVGSARLTVGDVDLVRLVRQMVQDNLGKADEKRIDLTLALPPKAPKIQGDKQRLGVLLSNLIGNAVKYTPEDGKVHVSVEVQDGRLAIAVRDTGIGISPEDQAHVFEKFYRATDDAVQQVTGTGLGLALAREVARLHGGDILLESEVGQGSTFMVELPLPTDSLAEVSAS